MRQLRNKRPRISFRTRRHRVCMIHITLLLLNQNYQEKKKIPFYTVQVTLMTGDSREKTKIDLFFLLSLKEHPFLLTIHLTKDYRSFL